MFLPFHCNAIPGTGRGPIPGNDGASLAQRRNRTSLRGISLLRMSYTMCFSEVESEASCRLSWMTRHKFSRQHELPYVIFREVNDGHAVKGDAKRRLWDR